MEALVPDDEEGEPPREGASPAGWKKMPREKSTVEVKRGFGTGSGGA